jgi:hypothetical protein
MDKALGDVIQEERKKHKAQKPKPKPKNFPVKKGAQGFRRGGGVPP